MRIHSELSRPIMQFKWFIIAVAIYQVAFAEEAQKDAPKKSWFDKTADVVSKVAEKAKDTVKSTGTISKDTASLVGNAVQKGTDMGKKGGELGSTIVKGMIHGGLEIGKLGVGGTAEITKDALGIVKEAANIFTPSIINKPLGSMIDLGDAGVDKAASITKGVIGKVDHMSQKIVNGIGGLWKKGFGFANCVTQKGVVGVKGTIEKGTDTIVGGIDKATGAINGIIKTGNNIMSIGDGEIISGGIDGAAKSVNDMFNNNQ